MDRLARNNRGQILIEAIVAISLMVIGLFGIFGVLSQSLGLNRIATDQYIAVGLASEGVEVAKNVLDSNAIRGGSTPWNQCVDAADEEYAVDYTTECLDDTRADKFLEFDDSTGLYGYDLENGRQTKFERLVQVENLSPDRIRVTATVNWRGRGGVDYDIVIQDNFYNWRDLR